MKKKNNENVDRVVLFLHKNLTSNFNKLYGY